MSKSNKLTHRGEGWDKGPIYRPHVPLSPPWQVSNATYLAGRSYLDGADALAHDLETQWGAGRLRLLVDPELRQKFDRQRVLLNEAVTSGGVADVQREASRMCSAWKALDAAARAAGAKPLASNVWEFTKSTGAVVALVRTPEEAQAVVAQGREVEVWTLEEVVRLIEGFPEIVKAKQVFPGSTVERIERIVDPLESWERGDDLPPLL